MKPYLIKGGKRKDERGELSFVNDLDLGNTKRFYVLTNAEDKKTRGWMGHKKDVKHFYCIKGAFEIAFVKIDDWLYPSLDLHVEKITLSENESQILVVPSGYATAIKDLKDDSILINFSPLSIDETENESIRFDLNTWKF